MKYVYPAIFTKEENGQYSIEFPDLEDCYTCGDDIQHGLIMAADVLALTMYDYEQEGWDIPSPSNMENIPVSENKFVNYIICDTMEYRKRYNNRAIKKSVTIPEWLNQEAMAKGINFSRLLQEALKERMGIG